MKKEVQTGGKTEDARDVREKGTGEEEELSLFERKMAERQRASERESVPSGKRKDARRGGRGNGARGALEAELCVLLNAGHKLPVFCFRKTMRELTQGRGKSDEPGRAAGRTLFSASPSLAGWTCILFPRALEYSRCARPLFRRRTHKSHFLRDRRAFFRKSSLYIGQLPCHSSVVNETLH